MNVEELVESATANTIIEAAAANSVFWTDDRVLRAIAQNEFGVQGVCTLSLVKEMEAASKLSEKDAEKIYYFLAKEYYRLTPIDQGTLWQAYVSDVEGLLPFRKVLNQLNYSGHNEAYIFTISVDTIRRLYLESVDPVRLDYLVIVLDSFNKTRPREKVARGFMNASKGALRLLPIQRKAFETIVSAWGAGTPSLKP